jgi:hypothetical protein
MNACEAGPTGTVPSGAAMTAASNPKSPDPISEIRPSPASTSKPVLRKLNLLVREPRFNRDPPPETRYDHRFRPTASTQRMRLGTLADGSGFALG